MAHKGNRKWWEYFIPGYGMVAMASDVIGAVGQFINDFKAGNVAKTVLENGSPVADQYKDVTNIDINPADPTSSAANVIDYDPSKSAQENMLGYAQANNSASAYAQFLANQHEMEMSNTAISRAIADAEANGISKYQLFQSGNMAASTPSSGSSMYQSYENAMNRRESLNEKELAMISAIIVSTINSAFNLIGKVAG